MPPSPAFKGPEKAALSPIPALLADGLRGSPVLPGDSGVPKSTTPPLPSTLPPTVVSPPSLGDPSPLAHPAVPSLQGRSLRQP